MNKYEKLTNEELLKLHREYAEDIKVYGKSPLEKEIFNIWGAMQERKGILPTYFCFRDQNTDTDHLLAINCSESEYNEWEEEDLDDGGFISDMESEYGVHDINCGMDANEITVGFTSYEVEEDQFPEFLEKWKQKLIELGWTTPDTQWRSRVVED